MASSATLDLAGRPTSGRGTVSIQRAAGAALALGSFGVAVTSALYALAPPAAALPAFPIDLALAGTAAGAGMLSAAGRVGIFSDVVMATGALLIVLELARRGRSTAAAGWTAILLSIVVFILVDAVAGYVLGPMAARGDGAAAFAGFKLLFDALFMLGTLAFGSGTALALADETRAQAPMLSRSMALLGVAIGVAASLAALACFLGLPMGQGAGLSIALGSVFFAVAGVQIARGA
ncbi:hypothetical protein JQ596_07225 [Bradyrhizobium manausense]|uniref:hypothetical protein n=1 Tax=Bradyrhizobium TaxID=374 RepID=UPI001BA79E5E|nr:MULTISPECIES: hypothetical protein [Bradyrhizobium]MBR0825321.1 hypothetical protein [Bradyrhizobium manausense]UVO28503.1 hypothetical protein KUF59_39635 [Bradyrhizobium arachidis]